EAQGDEADKMAAFAQTLHQIKHRLEIFTSLPDASLGKMVLQQTARDLGKT
ncbi:MAG: protein-tyrosine-phosphatase, partial [Betaproteobacteria bacterium]|nr:protein-tyrosine-phosphatase [Betaproteobacteria bacterium]